MTKFISVVSSAWWPDLREMLINVEHIAAIELKDKIVTIHFNGDSYPLTPASSTQLLEILKDRGNI